MPYDTAYTVRFQGLFDTVRTLIFRNRKIGKDFFDDFHNRHVSCGMLSDVVNLKSPVTLATSPMALVYPLCGAKPGHDCQTVTGIHLR